MLNVCTHSLCNPIENIRVTVRDLDGNILEQTILKNTITNLLFNLYRDALAGDLTHKDDLEIHYLAIGDDDGSILPLAATNTVLGNEVFRIALTSFSKPAIGQYRTVFYLAPSEAVGWIREIGWYSGTAAQAWGGGAGVDTGTLHARVFWVRNKTVVESVQFERLDGIMEA